MMGAERRAINVRLIAERRYGELLKQLAKNQGQRNDKLPPDVGGGSQYSEALQRDGISQQAASRYQALAEVSKEVFDEALRDETRPPALRKIIDQARDPQPTINPAALWLWGRMRDFERDGYACLDPARLFSNSTQSGSSGRYWR